VDERGELVFGPARPHPAEIVGHIAWRYRNELAPYYTVVGLAIVGETGHVYAPALWPLALPVGAGVVAATWRWLTNRRPERVYALAVGGAATVWTDAVWWASWDTRWFFWTAVVGATAAGIPRWWHYRRRGRITVQRGSWRGARRELRRIVKRWPELAAEMELPGSHVQRAEADPIGFTLTLALRSGLTAADVVGRLSRVESALRTRPGAARLLPDTTRADRAFLRIVRHDPLATPIPWPGSAATSINEPIALGRFEHGDTVTIALVGEHVLIGGAMGRGKSGLLNVIMAELSVRRDAVVWGIDMKRGLELSPWRPMLDRLATTEVAAHELLSAANRVLDARAELLAEHGERKWLPNASAPALVVAVDELAELNAEAMALFERVARMGRALAITLVAVTQRPSAAALGGLDARTQLTVRVSLGVVEARDTELILGPGRLSAGWRAERLSGPGYFLVLVPGQHELPRPARVYWLSDEAVRTAAAQPAVRRQSLDAASAQAVEAPFRAPQPSQEASDSNRRDDPDEALLAALMAAPSAGLTARELAARIGRSRSWTFERLRHHAKAGRAVQLGHGRWCEVTRPRSGRS
jgi:S-DNA-T family DNA segregation ATPase FtsK/SpoIIIE